MRKLQLLCCTLLFAIGVQSASAFALLGPYAPWMYRVPGYVTNNPSNLPNIGGPMNIGQGYRWNVPTITYAYDQSFLDFFGANGVAAIESAIQILNSLPPASSIVVSNYPTLTEFQNTTASQSALMDLKSSALAYLLEQMGLASPAESTFCLASNFDLSLPLQSINLRNFDATTLEPSYIINGVFYEYDGAENSNPFPQSILTQDFTNELSEIHIFSVDPTVVPFTSVADDDVYLSLGCFYTGLTVDDVGGLKYLLNTNNVALESVLPNVTAIGANANDFVNRALRPGVDKITFKRLQLDAITGQSFPVTNQYVDTYLTNGLFQQQTLQRIVTQPDIIFSAKYLADSNAFYPVEVSGTQGWVNNGAPGQDGPGVIQPPVRITFNTFSPSIDDQGSAGRGTMAQWGSFDGSSNAPIIYPIVAGAFPQTKIHLWLYFGGNSLNELKTWNVSGSSNDVFYLQSSTNLLNWTNVMNVTNVGNDARFLDESYFQHNYTQRYFRVTGP